MGTDEPRSNSQHHTSTSGAGSSNTSSHARHYWIEEEGPGHFLGVIAARPAPEVVHRGVEDRLRCQLGQIPAALDAPLDPRLNRLARVLVEPRRFSATPADRDRLLLLAETRGVAIGIRADAVRLLSSWVNDSRVGNLLSTIALTAGMDEEMRKNAALAILLSEDSAVREAAVAFVRDTTVFDTHRGDVALQMTGAPHPEFRQAAEEYAGSGAWDSETVREAVADPARGAKFRVNRYADLEPSTPPLLERQIWVRARERTWQLFRAEREEQLDSLFFEPTVSGISGSMPLQAGVVYVVRQEHGSVGATVHQTGLSGLAVYEAMHNDRLRFHTRLFFLLALAGSTDTTDREAAAAVARDEQVHPVARAVIVLTLVGSDPDAWDQLVGASPSEPAGPRLRRLVARGYVSWANDGSDPDDDYEKYGTMPFLSQCWASIGVEMVQTKHPGWLVELAHALHDEIAMNGVGTQIPRKLADYINKDLPADY